MLCLDARSDHNMLLDLAEFCISRTGS